MFCRAIDAIMPKKSLSLYYRIQIFLIQLKKYYQIKEPK